eukprot:14338408-Alexandrium_andersonii.AAC.1
MPQVFPEVLCAQGLGGMVARGIVGALAVGTCVCGPLSYDREVLGRRRRKKKKRRRSGRKLSLIHI